MHKKQKALLAVAIQFLGVTEEGGNNSGPLVERFQRAVDGKTAKEPWCMAFVQYCVKKVDELAEVLAGDTDKADIVKSEHCMTVWNGTPKELRLAKPEPGCVVIWRHGNTDAGHTGIVTEVLADGSFKTYEGNTGPGAGVQREGDGVYNLTRKMSGSGDMKVVGFLKPWK